MQGLPGLAQDKKAANENDQPSKVPQRAQQADARQGGQQAEPAIAVLDGRPAHQLTNAAVGAAGIFDLDL